MKIIFAKIKSRSDLRSWKTVVPVLGGLLTTMIILGQGCGTQFAAVDLSRGTASLGGTGLGAGNGGTDAGTASALFKEAYAVIEAKCIFCHGPGGSAAHLSFDFKDEAQFFATRWFIPGNVNAPVLLRMKGSGQANANMPLGNMAWTSTDFDKIKNWLLAANETPVPTSEVRPNPAFKCDPQLAAVRPSLVQRLTKKHYLASVSDFLSRLAAVDKQGLMTSTGQIMDLWPNDASPNYSRWDSSVLQGHADSAFEGAYALATGITANATILNSMIRDSVCGNAATKTNLANDACLTSFVNYYGRKVFRRPLLAAELSEWKTYFNSFTGDDRIVALLTRLLSHPRFIYPLDIGEDTPTAISGTVGLDATYRLSKYELLSKITFAVWGAPPDDALYTLVSTLDVNRAADLDRLLDEVFARAGQRTEIGDFFAEWLHVIDVPQFDNTSAAYRTLMAGENIGDPTRNYRAQMIDEIVEMGKYYTLTTDGRYENLMSSPYSFARGEDLARLYGVPAWNGVSAPPPFPSGQNRTGLLTRAALLASSDEYTHPILKGRRVRVRMLCDEIPPPPGDLQIKPVIHTKDVTTAQAISLATADAKCMTCHNLMNPIGFATENFDSFGRYRAKESKFATDGTVASQLAIDINVNAQLYHGDTKMVTNGADLAAHIADTGLGQACFVRNYFRFINRRPESVSADGCALESGRQNLTGPGGNIKKMMRDQIKQITFTQRKIN